LGKLPDGVPVDPTTLKKAGLVRHASSPVKILGTGDVSRAFEVQGCELSQTARDKIEAAGGKVA
jgi:large subunit ribosomal protein L15